jgi:hypothetical protein
MNMQLGAAKHKYLASDYAAMFSAERYPSYIGDSRVMAASPELELADPFIKMKSKQSHVSRLPHMNDIYGV